MLFFLGRRGGGEADKLFLTVRSVYLVLTSWVIWFFFFFHSKNVISCVSSEISPAIIPALKEFGFHYRKYNGLQFL